MIKIPESFTNKDFEELPKLLNTQFPTDEEVGMILGLLYCLERGLRGNDMITCGIRQYLTGYEGIKYMREKN